MCYDDVVMYQSFGYGKMCFFLSVDNTEVDMIRSILDRYFLIYPIGYSKSASKRYPRFVSGSINTSVHDL